MTESLADVPPADARPRPTDPRLSGLLGLLHRQGLAALLDTLVQRATKYSVVMRGGHQIAHALGRLAGSKHYGDASVIRECRPVFASGGYHGVVERTVAAAYARLCRQAAARVAPARNS